MKSLKVVLIFPPQSSPFLPHRAVPLLTSSLRKSGFDVVSFDYNLDSYEYFLSPPVLEKSGVSSFIASQVESIKKGLRTGFDFFLPSDYYFTIATLEDLLKIVSRHYGNVLLTFKDYIMDKYSPYSSEDILKASVDPQNMYVDFFKQKVEEIKRVNPSLVGISVSWDSQMIPAFTLARQIRRVLPQVHITMGGSFITHLSCYLKHKRKLFSVVDSFLPNRGELSIVKLAQGISKKDLKDVPNLIYLKGKRVVQNKEDTSSSFYWGDFSSFPLDKYYSPQVYLPIEASFGCYWGRCAFCTHHISGGMFQSRKAEDIFMEMKHQEKVHGCKNYYFVDDAAPPSVLLKLSQLIAQEGKKFRWAAEIRAEKMVDEEFFVTLYRGGCRLLLFGLESYSDRILSLMQKGWSKDRIKNVLKWASKAGIITWVFFFLGFPGERRYEAKETLKFIWEYKDFIDVIAPGVFVLTKHSKVYANLSDFGVIDVFDDPDKDLQLTYEASFKEGISQEDAYKLLEVFKKDERTSKFLRSFFAEPHILFFRKSHFTPSSSGAS